MRPGKPIPAPRKFPVALYLADRPRMASHISSMTWSRPRASLVPSVTFSRSFPSALTAAMRRLVPPRSTPMEKSGMEEKIIRTAAERIHSFLAVGAVVAAAAGDHDAFDGRLADQAGFAFAAVDAVLQLEEAFFAVSIDVVRDGGSAEGNRFPKNLFYRREQLG